MSRKIDILNKLNKLCSDGSGIEAKVLADHMHLDRSTVSRYLNQLVREKQIIKGDGRPVLYYKLSAVEIEVTKMGLDHLIGADGSLNKSIQQAKAAILYPPFGLHTLILGETGVGKSFFAKKMHGFSIESEMKGPKAPFVTLNCADFADNPQLLMSQIFGSKKGAYTGATEDKVGLLKSADGGIFFLDEVHRLPSQGQEMLFTYIDQGVFRPLGSEKNVEGVMVQIIAATTEAPGSYLLDTFRRRIPMVIELPSLRNRSLKERMALVNAFIKEESKRISKSIHFSRNSIVSFMLYECMSNIGQLKSDIQLACAKGFLNYKTKGEKYIAIRNGDLPEHVRTGLFEYQKNRKIVDQLLPLNKDLIKYHYEETSSVSINDSIYSEMDSKVADLKRNGIEASEIERIVNSDIEKHFGKFIEHSLEPTVLNNLEQLVGSDVLKVAREILNMVSSRLNREYSKTLLAAFAMHLKSSVERIVQGEVIVNPKLNDIRRDHPDSFIAAMDAARLLENRFDIILPIDEIGYITMFLNDESVLEDEGIEDERVKVLTLMHGNTTASSMTQVVNELIGEEYALSLDMPLNLSAEEMYERVNRLVADLHCPKGLIVMVDMGSLMNFADMIYEDLGILTKTMDMVSTPLLLDVTRKAINGRSLEEIMDSMQSTRCKRSSVRQSKKSRQLLIVTACYTGEGASERLKRILSEKLVNFESVQIESINIMNRKEFLLALDHYKESHNLISVVSTVKIHLNDVPVFNALDVLDGKAIDAIDHIIEKERLYIDIADSVKDKILLDHIKVVMDIRKFIAQMEDALRIKIHNDSVIGLTLHMIFMLDALKRGEKGKTFPELNHYINKYGFEMEMIRNHIKILEETYDLEIADDEVAYLTQMIIFNQLSE